MTNVHIGSVCEYFIPRTVGGCGRKGVTGGGLRDFMTLPKYQFALCSAFVMADVMSFLFWLHTVILIMPLRTLPVNMQTKFNFLP